LRLIETPVIKQPMCPNNVKSTVLLVNCKLFKKNGGEMSASKIYRGEMCIYHVNNRTQLSIIDVKLYLTSNYLITIDYSLYSVFGYPLSLVSCHNINVGTILLDF